MLAAWQPTEEKDLSFTFLSAHPPSISPIRSAISPPPRSGPVALFVHVLFGASAYLGVCVSPYVCVYFHVYVYSTLIYARVYLVCKL